ncbi:MAG TPA: sugar transferase [Longimicrobiales bacterium]
MSTPARRDDHLGVMLAPASRGLGRRAVDVVGAAVLLALTAPLLAFGALLVLVGSGRPVLFGHVRLGRGGRSFRCWKLRTMVVDAEARLERDPALRRRYVEHDFKLPLAEDPRVTRVGRWLRRTHLDELPQLVNVLRGEMSLVGPRPIVRDELEWFGSEAAVLLSEKPGIFGEWSSRGRRRPGYPERARLELYYVRNRTLGRDLRILLRSIPAVFAGQGDR